MTTQTQTLYDLASRSLPETHAEELLAALIRLRSEVRAAIKFDVRKHYSLMLADVMADQAIRKATGAES